MSSHNALYRVQTALRKTSIHPSAIIDPTAYVGEGTSIGAGTVIEAGAYVGEYCKISRNNVTVYGNVVIGDYVLVQIWSDPRKHGLWLRSWRERKTPALPTTRHPF